MLGILKLAQYFSKPILILIKFDFYLGNIFLLYKLWLRKKLCTESMGDLEGKDFGENGERKASYWKNIDIGFRLLVRLLQVNKIKTTQTNEFGTKKKNWSF
nr:uncharacterized protein LOC104096431 [Nicotiana tomentosiformis]